MNYAVVIPNKHPELAWNLIDSIRNTHPNPPLIIVVADNHQEQFGSYCITVPTTFDRFVFARNVNLGIQAAGRKDVILINDDCFIEEENCLNVLVSVASKHPRLGILSPLIDGGIGNPYQAKANWQVVWPEVIGIKGKEWDSVPVCFPCVYLSRAMIDSIGLMDENYVDYGFDDNDLCIRARRAGWETGITGRVTVKHGIGGLALIRGENWSCSFAREADRISNERYFRSKFPPPVQILPL